jgi:DNA-binding transcriptional LysR family regulator
MNLNAIDLKLLIVFDAVMRERSVSRAAQYVGMSQPAVSNALGKLRHVLNDDLFVRVAGGVRPTPRSQELALPIHDVLTQLQSAFDPVEFAPATASRTFHIAASDHGAILILPDLLERLRSRAPGIQLRVRPKRDHMTLAQLDSGEIDFVLGIFGDLPGRMRHVSLFHDDYVCVMRAGHPLAGRPMTLRDFLTADHLAMTHVGETAQLFDGLLARRGLERNITMTINQSLLSPMILRRSDLIMTTLARLVSRVSAFDGLHVMPVPLDLEPAEIRLAWPQTLGKHPAHVWMQEQILDVCSGLR